MKKTPGTRLLEKALSDKVALGHAARQVANYLVDYGNLANEEHYIISKELKANRKTIANTPAYKTAMKKIAVMAEQKFVEQIHAQAGYHEKVIQNQTTMLKSNMSKESFMQTAAKKLNKKELAQLKKLLPVDVPNVGIT
jgi:hypothetical protein